MKEERLWQGMKKQEKEETIVFILMGIIFIIFTILAWINLISRGYDMKDRILSDDTCVLYCSEDGTKLSMNSEFCPSCGKAVYDVAYFYVPFCSNCGKRINVDSSFCNSCSAAIDKNSIRLKAQLQKVGCSNLKEYHAYKRYLNILWFSTLLSIFFLYVIFQLCIAMIKDKNKEK